MPIVPKDERTAWFRSRAGVTLTAAHDAFLDWLAPTVEVCIWAVIGYDITQQTTTEFLPQSNGERPPLEFGIDVGWDRIGGVVMPRSRMDPSQGVLTVSRLPVRSVTSVYENIVAWTTGATNGNWPASSLLPITAYRADMAEENLCKNGRIYRTVGSWPTVPRTVKITYVAGYTQAEIDTTQSDLKLAELETLGWWWGKAMRRSNSVKTMGLAFTQVGIRDFSASVADPSQISSNPGVWANNVLSPEALNILGRRVNMARFLGG